MLSQSHRWPKVVLPEEGRAPGGRESENRNQERGREICPFLESTTSTTSSSSLTSVPTESREVGVGEGELTKEPITTCTRPHHVKTFADNSYAYLSSNTWHNKA